MIAAVDWSGLGSSLAIAFIAFMQVYRTWRAKCSDATLRDVKEAVVKVEKQGNSVSLELKRVNMVYAQRLAEVTRLDADIAVAKDAQAVYQAALAAAVRDGAK